MYTKRICYILCIALFCLSCKNDKSDTPPQDSSAIQKDTLDTARLTLGCYVYDKTHKITLKVTELGDSIKGKLDIHYQGKDANSGHFVGTVNDGKLIGLYTFMSEGIESQRQIAYALHKNQLFMGFGPMNSEGTHFIDVKSLQYDRQNPLTKSDCP